MHLPVPIEFIKLVEYPIILFIVFLAVADTLVQRALCWIPREHCNLVETRVYRVFKFSEALSRGAMRMTVIRMAHSPEKVGSSAGATQRMK
jgi:hypothetical protein